jgi:raffinose/stachyose/melibiose transport system substrate-binding protein
MHNGYAEPQTSYWLNVAQKFEELHPGVSVVVKAVENDVLRNALPIAFADGTTPDLFQSWGSGDLINWVNQGIVWDLTEPLAPTIAELGSMPGNWSLNDSVYGLPYTIGPAGLWVNMNLAEQAGLLNGGVLDWPSDLGGLFELWGQLKAANITPVAVGGGTGWAGPWWYYVLVTKTCSAEAIFAAGTRNNFDDECWLTAAKQLGEVVDQNTFADGWEVAMAQGAEDSSSGLVVNGKAAMELSGPWSGAVMSFLYDGPIGATEAPEFIQWFPFPETNGDGSDNIMASGDGFSVLNPDLGSPAKSNAAAALLAHILSNPMQTLGLTATGSTAPPLPGIPTNQTVTANVSDPVLKAQVQAINSVTNHIPWLDVYFGPTIAAAMNNQLNIFMRGQGTAEDVVAALKTGAGLIPR